MKKFFLYLPILLSIESFSQITVDFQNTIRYLRPIHLTSEEVVYFDDNQWNMNQQNQFTLYNLDGSFYKTIMMPPKPDTSSFIFTIFWISRTLFDNDPSNIEYYVCYTYDSSIYQKKEVKIIREDGTILLDELNALLDYWPPLIYNTPEGAKMLLIYEYANGWYYQTKVFNLPGEIPTKVEEENNITNDNMVLYPNPNNGSFSIKVLNKGNELKTIDLYTSNGQLVGTYRSTGNMIHINNYGLSDGAYLLNVRSESINSQTKMIIKK